jgi:purine nucleosidase
LSESAAAVACLLTLLAVVGPARGADHRIILDTDLGGDIDDAFVVALALNCPELEIVGIATVGDEEHKRARIACKMLKLAGRTDVPVAAGPKPGDPKQGPWAADFDEVKPIDTPAPEFIVQQINAHPGEITLVPVGPLTNIAAALDLDPGIASKVKQMVTMGGAAYVCYNLQPPPCAEYNIRADIPAAQKVYSSGMPITMCGLDVTAMLRFDAEKREQLAKRGLPLTDALAELYKLWGGETPVLYDPMALCMVIDSSFCEIERQRVVVTDEGVTQIVEGEPNVGVCIKPDVDRFFEFYIERVVKPEQ